MRGKPATTRATRWRQTRLDALADRVVATLSHGQRRQLEVAMCVATRPQVLLLDEPLAGMGGEETATMLELLASLRDGHAIMLVEHDMDAVFRIADRITVMVNGAVIASDAPAAVRANAAVQAAYLGRPRPHERARSATAACDARDVARAHYGASHVLRGVDLTIARRRGARAARAATAWARPR